MATQTRKTTKTTKTVSSAAEQPFTVPGLTVADAATIGEGLQLRLHALNDLQLVLKHAHWNVVGPHFIGVHEMLDPQVDGVRDMVDVMAERMATLGIPPVGTPGALVEARTWNDYSLMRADAAAHLAALDLVYNGVIEDHRTAAEEIEKLDIVSHDMLVGQIAELEKYQWFIRSHLQGAATGMVHGNSVTELGAARRAVAAR